MERVGDHAAREDVLDGEGTPARIDRLRIGTAVVADDRSDVCHRLGGGAVQMHVAAGHQGELGGGEHAVRGDELVGGPGPGRRGGVLPMGPGLAGRDEDGGGETSGDRERGLEHGGDAER